MIIRNHTKLDVHFGLTSTGDRLPLHFVLCNGTFIYHYPATNRVR